MSRLVDSLDKMRSETKLHAVEDQHKNAEDFKQFYSCRYYKIFRDKIEAKLAQLDREDVNDAQSLLMRQGTRQGLRSILDDLDTLERAAARVLINAE